MPRKIFKKTKMSDNNIFRSNKAKEITAKIWRSKNYRPKDSSAKPKWDGGCCEFV